MNFKRPLSKQSIKSESSNDSSFNKESNSHRLGIQDLRQNSKQSEGSKSNIMFKFKRPKKRNQNSKSSKGGSECSEESIYDREQDFPETEKKSKASKTFVKIDEAITSQKLDDDFEEIKEKSEKSSKS